jgi:hypothetical protein
LWRSAVGYEWPYFHSLRIRGIVLYQRTFGLWRLGVCG